MSDPVAVLRLTPRAEHVARALLAAFPSTVFTSGRRDRAAQAQAMGRNVVAFGRRWISKTYKDGPVTRALQAWLDQHPAVVTFGMIVNGLLSVLYGFDDDALVRFTNHFDGNAFDVQPVHGTGGAKVHAWLRAREDITFLDHEGGAERWHVAAVKDAPTAQGGA